jgi:hypothetical protein
MRRSNELEVFSLGGLGCRARESFRRRMIN